AQTLRAKACQVVMGSHGSHKFDATAGRREWQWPDRILASKPHYLFKACGKKARALNAVRFLCKPDSTVQFAHGLMFCSCKVQSLPRALVVAATIMMPSETALPHRVQETDEQKGNEYHHFNKALNTHVAEINRPRVHKNHFDVKQHKQDRDKKVPDVQRQSCIALRFYPAFERLKFHFGLPQRTQTVGNDHGSAYEQNRQSKH